jgi:hypothetical protein
MPWAATMASGGRLLGYRPDKRLAVTVSTRNLPPYRDPAVILIDQLKGSALVREEHPGLGPFKFAGIETGQSIKGVRNPDYYHEGCLTSTGSPAFMPTSRRFGSRRSAAIGRRSSSAACRLPCATSW